MSNKIHTACKQAVFFEYPFSKEETKKIEIVFEQNDKIILKKTLKNCFFSENILSVMLTQEETMLFDSVHEIKMQIQCVLIDGATPKSIVMSTFADEILTGKSAYEIWLEQGNVGTEQDFLDSLKGEKEEEKSVHLTSCVDLELTQSGENFSCDLSQLEELPRYVQVEAYCSRSGSERGTDTTVKLIAIVNGEEKTLTQVSSYAITYGRNYLFLPIMKDDSATSYKVTVYARLSSSSSFGPYCKMKAFS